MPPPAHKEIAGERHGKIQHPLYLHGPERSVDGGHLHAVEHTRKSRLYEIDEAQIGNEILPELPREEIVGRRGAETKKDGEQHYRSPIRGQDAAATADEIRLPIGFSQIAARHQKAAYGKESADGIVRRKRPIYRAIVKMVEMGYEHTEGHEISHHTHIVGHRDIVWHYIGS